MDLRVGANKDLPKPGQELSDQDRWNSLGTQTTGTETQPDHPLDFEVPEGIPHRERDRFRLRDPEAISEHCGDSAEVRPIQILPVPRKLRSRTAIPVSGRLSTSRGRIDCFRIDTRRCRACPCRGGNPSHAAPRRSSFNPCPRRAATGATHKRAKQAGLSPSEQIAHKSGSLRRRFCGRVSSTFYEFGAGLGPALAVSRLSRATSRSHGSLPLHVSRRS